MNETSRSVFLNIQEQASTLGTTVAIIIRDSKNVRTDLVANQLSNTEQTSKLWVELRRKSKINQRHWFQLKYKHTSTLNNMKSDTAALISILNIKSNFRINQYEHKLTLSIHIVTYRSVIRRNPSKTQTADRPHTFKTTDSLKQLN